MEMKSAHKRNAHAALHTDAGISKEDFYVSAELSLMLQYGKDEDLHQRLNLGDVF